MQNTTLTSPSCGVNDNHLYQSPKNHPIQNNLTMSRPEIMVLWQKSARQTARHTTHDRTEIVGWAERPRVRGLFDFTSRAWPTASIDGRHWPCRFHPPRPADVVAEPAHRCGYHTPPWPLADRAAAACLDEVVSRPCRGLSRRFESLVGVRGGVCILTLGTCAMA